MRFNVVLLLSVLSFTFMGCKMRFNEREAALGGTFTQSKEPKTQKNLDNSMAVDQMPLIEESEIKSTINHTQTNKDFEKQIEYQKVTKLVKLKTAFKNHAATRAFVKNTFKGKTSKIKSSSSMVSENNLIGWVSVLLGLFAFILGPIFLKFIFGGLAIGLGYFSKKMHWGFMADMLGMIAIVLGLFAILGGLINQLLNLVILLAVLLILWILIRYLLGL